MRKAAARAKSTGVTDDSPSNQEGWLGLDPVPLLSRHLEQHLCRAGQTRRKAWTRRTLAKLALDISLVSLGVRRAALIDTCAPSVDDCLTIAQAMRSFSETSNDQQGSRLSDALRNRGVLAHHVPTGQTFLLDRSKHMWTDRPSPSPSDVGASDKRLWIDVRANSNQDSCPRVTSPSAHVQMLIDVLHDAVVNTEAVPDVPNCFLIEAKATKGSHEREEEDKGKRRTQQVLAGTALAGWLLEYSSVYCLETPASASFDDSHTKYSVRSIAQTQPTDTLASDSWSDMDAESMKNCLDSQPLVLFRVLLCSPVGKLELIAFSVPQTLLSSAEEEHFRQYLQNTFEQRLLAVAPETGLAKQLALGSILVQASYVCLDRVAL